MIKITSKQHLFRRAGMAHPKGTVEYPDGKFSQKQLKALKAEPRLKVEIVQEKKRKEGGPNPGDSSQKKDGQQTTDNG